MLEDINDIANKKNELESELSNYKNELESKERNVLKDIADRLSIKFDIETPGNFDELLNEIINQSKPGDPELIYIAKKKFAIYEGQFIKVNLNRIPQECIVEVFGKINEDIYNLIPDEEKLEYAKEIN